MIKKSLILISVLTVLAAALQGAATFVIDDSSTGAGIDFVVVDNGAGDLNPAVGGLTFFGMVGPWSITASGTTDSAVSPIPNIFETNLSTTLISAVASTLTVAFVDGYASALPFPDPFASPGAILNYTSLGAAAIPVSFALQGGLAPAIPVVGGALPSPFVGATLLSSGPHSGIFTTGLLTAAAPVSPYSLAAVATLVTASSVVGQTTAFSTSIQAVPEPGLYGLLAVGLSGLYFFGVRRKKRGRETGAPNA